MSNNCYRKGKAKRRQHKSRGICPDPAWARHFASAHCWRGASSLCQCHIKVLCVVWDFSIPGQEQPKLPEKWAGTWNCSRTKAHVAFEDVWGNVKSYQSYGAIQETLTVRRKCTWQSYMGFRYQCIPKKVVNISPNYRWGTWSTELLAWCHTGGWGHSRDASLVHFCLVLYL